MHSSHFVVELVLQLGYVDQHSYALPGKPFKYARLELGLVSKSACDGKGASM